MASQDAGEGLGHIAVIGAGIIGCAAALFLQRDGHRVTLIDPRGPGSGTSLGNAGVISLYSLQPIVTGSVLRGLPNLLRDPLGPLSVRWPHLPVLIPWLVRAALNCRGNRPAKITEAIARLSREASRAHDIIIQQCGLADLVRSGGWLKVAFDPRRLDAATLVDRALYDHYGLPYEVLDRGRVHDLEPALSPEVRAGLWLTLNRAVRHPQRYVEGIARTVMERGGRFLAATAQDFATESGRVLAVLTDRGPLEVDGVVLAAGAFSGRLACAAGTPVPLAAERGYHVMLPHPEPTLQRPIYTVEGGFVLAPMEHGLRLTGGVELARLRAAPDYRRIRRLLPVARRLVPSLGTRIDSEWQGHRPSLPDSLPVIGRSPRHRNLWLAFGHQHIGLTLGPLTGRLVADLVAGRDPGLDLTPYAADRRFA